MTPVTVFLMVSIALFIMSFISKRKHLLATLISLEGLMLMLFGMICYFATFYFHFFNFVLVFLTLSACEGALGLGLLVSIVRTYGSDHFNSMNSLQC
uniref:NADH-ubiquinone oxidoreductase chain 4L n=1 Tax=Daphnia magna TaxID=35525 RepID=A0A386Q0W6_9CRUS|nr:NADH dehydrogenase subunit 4L [Daphnia magna]AYE40702.1 NADH dehydrogenase subunit 4L [Daphnia magna]AYE40754.1 NADH dehydrogenase subunit 4L [Daphnia magna]AYE40780.1 NADH dehydrogenase subunit 4L [Daphnia magna]AYE40806.1 NADH dehydrogenase subunit 4L [Daphnia magna]